jgi:hypothetical protein
MLDPSSVLGCADAAPQRLVNRLQAWLRNSGTLMAYLLVREAGPAGQD